MSAFSARTKPEASTIIDTSLKGARSHPPDIIRTGADQSFNPDQTLRPMTT
jgi:hypothetical protein